MQFWHGSGSTGPSGHDPRQTDTSQVQAAGAYLLRKLHKTTVQTRQGVVDISGGARRRNRARFADGPHVCFIWIPKTAGTSVFGWLQQRTGMQHLKTLLAIRGRFPQAGPVTFGHMSYAHLLHHGHIKHAYHARSMRFAFVRNPYDRALSLYLYFRQDGRLQEGLRFIDFLRRIDSGVPSVGLYNRRGWSQCNPQVAWLRDADGWLVDTVARFENFDDEIDRLADRLGISPLHLQRNRSDRAVLARADPWTAEARAIVERVYAEDFKWLGYERVGVAPD